MQGATIKKSHKMFKIILSPGINVMCSEVSDSSTMKWNWAKWASPRCQVEYPNLHPVGMITKIPLQTDTSVS